ncbi:MAG: hypothetical protein P9X24_05540 [Candidatus Hatepunaea meridiana]|nr:hypothetical protein [Candidatus Hatepunaea meridiana]
MFFIVLAIIYAVFKVHRRFQRRINIFAPMIVGGLLGLIVMPFDSEIAGVIVCMGVFVGALVFVVTRGEI